MAEQFQLYDTTLRDGTQQEGMVLTVEDKLAVARRLDDLGVGFIEGGWPGAVPKDTEFFRRARTELDLGNAVLAAFGATRRPGVPASLDPQVRALLEAETPVVTLVAKSHTGHVRNALRTTLAENLAMISGTVRHLVHAGRRVFVDAEHYFDGYQLNREYALAVVRAAAEAGAETVVLCDTNGGSLPDEVRTVVTETLDLTGVPLGIHAHNDSGCAVANTMAAVDAGAVQAQGTAHGYGERCGNADLFTVIANLVLKRGREVIPLEKLRELARTGRAVTELTQVPGSAAAPYIGGSAFTHKAGLHASALRVDPDLYQHTTPEFVGNTMRTLVSDMGGRSSIELKARELGYAVEAGSDEVARAATRVKEMESDGYSFESADASFELLLREELDGGPRPRPFDVESWSVGVTGTGDEVRTEATVRLTVQGRSVTATGHGNGPVNAMDTALHTALDPCFPALSRLELTDYRVRVLSGETGSGAAARVLISYRDGERSWGTVGVDGNTTAASWQALLDAVHYVLLDGPPGRVEDAPPLAAAVPG
ncbi:MULTISPECIES: citramalate synthase [Streptomyces]|uniref:Citramalate synthase n=1 Tax=Streptomyces clavifer TaxID=68188 RepID=A0ABS4V5G1_9ACTN|nr:MULTISPECIES: citramalate synthase [Streptomyces]KQX81105.1 transferase [Streptomyces sp. Root1319]KQZ06917.1 transferase [Streptomyces sp. Root55]MBP2359072.1 2-isopropylmalate synthase [Streptomyces clavifer]MDX2745748.1 citramalate synthase [Streptomyces sp. NRRL_B-2557]MDX3062296.1 citramalate synthase [Streptomyces sp. ND04-05B]